MKKLIAMFMIVLCQTANATCIYPTQILKFNNSLLTRRCDWVSKVDLMRTQNKQYSTIYLGDSLVANGEFQGNMGIGGDTTQLLMQRLDIVINAHPSDVYILVGINDFYRSSGVANTFRLYNGVINMIKKEGINVHVISLIKCNNKMRPECRGINPKVEELNAKLASVPNIDYINIDGSLSDKNGVLEQYTTDGLHLNKTGYAMVYALTGK